MAAVFAATMLATVLATLPGALAAPAAAPPGPGTPPYWAQSPFSVPSGTGWPAGQLSELQVYTM